MQKFGTREKPEYLELFHPERLAWLPGESTRPNTWHRDNRFVTRRLHVELLPEKPTLAYI